MPLFRRKPADPTPPVDAPPAADPLLRDEATIRDALTSLVERSRATGDALCILYVLPQVLPGERIAAAEARVVATAIVGQLRDGDEAGALDDGAYLVVLPGSVASQAQIVAHRLATEFTVRSAAVNRRNWRVGMAAFPEDGPTPETLMAAALAEARRSSRAA